MTPEMIVRAWKDPEFRARLGSAAPASPAGSAQLSATDLVGETYLTSPICTDYGPRCSIPSCPIE